MTNEEVLRAVLRAFGEGIAAAQEAMRVHLTDECAWEMAGLRTTTGGDEAAQLFSSMEAVGFSSWTVEFRNVAVVGDVAFTERIDWLVRPDGSRLGPWPVVGVTEFRDGKISAWREYYDSRNLEMIPSG